MNPKCRICGCSDRDACAGSCAWVEPDLCSTCALIKEALAEYFEIAGPTSGRHVTTPADAAARFTELTERLLGEIDWDGVSPL